MIGEGWDSSFRGKVFNLLEMGGSKSHLYRNPLRYGTLRRHKNVPLLPFNLHISDVMQALNIRVNGKYVKEMENRQIWDVTRFGYGENVSIFSPLVAFPDRSVSLWRANSAPPPSSA